MAVSVHYSLAGGPVKKEDLEGLPQELAFSVEEYQGRLDKVRRGMGEMGVEVLVVQHPSNVLYLSGYQSFAMYQDECVILPIEGDPSLIVHPPELGGALLHSWFGHIYGYEADKSRESYQAKLLTEKGFGRSKIGIEKQSLGVPAGHFEALGEALSGAMLVDGSGLVEAVKMTKSPKEIEYLREAARITDLGTRATIQAAGEGKTDQDMAAAGYQTMIQAGSEYMCLGPIVTTGRRSGVLHSNHKRVRLNKSDSILIEVGGCIQRYTAPTMRSVSIGEPKPEVKRVADACITALGNVLTTIRPGITADEVAKAGWEGIAMAGEDFVFHGNFGYAVGAGFPPSWADGTALIESGIQTRLQPGMVFHHPIALRRLGQYGVAFSETSVVTAEGCEVLTSVERQLAVR